MFTKYTIKNNVDSDQIFIEGNGFILSIYNNFEMKAILKVNVVFTDLSIFNKGIDLLLSINNDSMEHDGTFYTDSNGLFEMKRKRGEKWETSVFPCNSFTILKNEND